VSPFDTNSVLWLHINMHTFTYTSQIGVEWNKLKVWKHKHGFNAGLECENAFLIVFLWLYGVTICQGFACATRAGGRVRGSSSIWSFTSERTSSRCCCGRRGMVSSTISTTFFDILHLSPRIPDLQGNWLQPPVPNVKEDRYHYARHAHHILLLWNWLL